MKHVLMIFALAAALFTAASVAPSRDAVSKDAVAWGSVVEDAQAGLSNFDPGGGGGWPEGTWCGQNGSYLHYRSGYTGLWYVFVCQSSRWRFTGIIY